MQNLTFPAGNSPNLHESINLTISKLKSKIIDLTAYIEKNRPLTNAEIDNLFKQKILTINQIEQYANFVDKQYSNIFVSLKIDGEIEKIELWELADLINLDVVRYYKLWNEYDSELKIRAFSKTSEYQQLYSKMKIKYDKIIGMYYYLPIDFSCYSNKYELKSKSFVFSTSELDGFQYGKNSNYIQFNPLCIKKPYNLKINEKVIFGGTDYFFEQDYFVPVQDESIALQLEENCETSTLLFIFKIKDIERKRTAFLNNSFIKTELTNLLLYDRTTEMIYLNYIYK